MVSSSSNASGSSASSSAKISILDLAGITKIKLSINGERVTAIDPFLEGKSVQPMDDEVLVVHGQKIIIRPYILPHISKMTPEEIKALGGKDGLRKQQGFYVYRNKRLLVWGTWFRMMRQGDLSKLARVRVDLPNTLDDLWTLDIKKILCNSTCRSQK